MSNESAQLESKSSINTSGNISADEDVSNRKDEMHPTSPNNLFDKKSRQENKKSSSGLVDSYSKHQSKSSFGIEKGNSKSMLQDKHKKNTFANKGDKKHSRFVIGADNRVWELNRKRNVNSHSIYPPPRIVISSAAVNRTSKHSLIDDIARNINQFVSKIKEWHENKKHSKSSSTAVPNKYSKRRIIS